MIVPISVSPSLPCSPDKVLIVSFKHPALERCIMYIAKKAWVYSQAALWTSGLGLLLTFVSALSLCVVSSVGRSLFSIHTSCVYVIDVCRLYLQFLCPRPSYSMPYTYRV